MTDETTAGIMQEAWAKAWVAACAELTDIKHGSTVDTGAFKYTYAALADIISEIRPKLASAGLAMSQSVIKADGGIGVETRITHSGGHTEVYGPTFIAVSGDAKAIGSAITYARRYGLTAALGIATEPDDDGGAASKSSAPKKVDHHDRAWKAAILLFEHDDQAPQFLSALREAGVGEGKRATKVQADKVIGLMEGLAG